MGDTKVIFWDVYGTLLTTQGGDFDSLVNRKAELRLAFEHTVRNFNLKAVPARLQDLFLRGIQAERDARMAEGVAHPEVRVDEIWFKLLENSQPEEPPTINFAREVALFFERQANPKQFQPRAFEVLTTLKQRGLRQGIISNAQFYTPIELSELLREESGGEIRTYESIFDAPLVFFSFDLGVVKPDPAGFHRAVKALTRENIMPDDCVFVGNSSANDIVPAQHVGFRTVLFAPGPHTQTAAKPDLVIHNLRQLLEWL
jgi:putative hydrolase of the HAD superfamily